MKVGVSPYLQAKALVSQDTEPDEKECPGLPHSGLSNRSAL